MLDMLFCLLFPVKLKAQAIPGPRRMQRRKTYSDEAGATENASTNATHAYHARCGFHHASVFDSVFVHGSILFLLTYYVNRLYKKMHPRLNPFMV